MIRNASNIIGPEVIISAACDNDLNAIVRLLKQQLAEHGLLTQARELRAAVATVLRNNGLGFILIARKENRVVGCAYVTFVWSMEHAGRAAWLEELYVVPEQRSAGVGQALLIEAQVRSRAENCRAMDLEVDDVHSRAGRLYERQGFVRLGRTRWVKKLEIP